MISHHSILVVDDEPDVQMLLRLFFERLGHQVYAAQELRADPIRPGLSGD